MKKIIISIGVGSFFFASFAAAQGFVFSYDLTLGASGQDVANLQTVLISKGFDIPAITVGAVQKGYFGGQTKAAVIRYQLSVGLPPTGYVGPLTRARLNGGGIIVPPGSPSISGVTAPTALLVGQTGTWVVRAADPQNQPLSYSVDWGDSVACPFGYDCTYAGAAPTMRTQQTSTFTHAFAAAGTYKVRFTVRNSAGLSAETTATVLVTNSASSGGLRITSPNGGEMLLRGSTHTILWTSPQYFRATYADLKLLPIIPPCAPGSACPAIAMMPLTIASNIDISKNVYVWKVGQGYYSMGGVVGAMYSEAVVPDGQYSLQICETGTVNCDTSDTPFTIVTNLGNLPDINILSPNGGEVWSAGGYNKVNVNVSGEPSKIGNTIAFYLVDSNNQQRTLHTANFDGSAGVKTIEVPVSYNVPGGTYRLLVHLISTGVACMAIGCPPPVQQIQAYDYSDSFFTITSWGSNCLPGYICEPLVM